MYVRTMASSHLFSFGESLAGFHFLLQIMYDRSSHDRQSRHGVINTHLFPPYNFFPTRCDFKKRPIFFSYSARLMVINKWGRYFKSVSALIIIEALLWYHRCCCSRAIHLTRYQRTYIRIPKHNSGWTRNEPRIDSGRCNPLAFPLNILPRICYSRHPLGNSNCSHRR